MNSYDKFLYERAKEMRNNPTLAEASFQSWCKKNNLQPRSQYVYKVSDNKGYILDFYWPHRNIAVEIDGCVHKTEEHIAKDKQREEDLAKAGIYVIRLWNKEVTKKNLDERFPTKLKYATAQVKKMKKKLNNTKKAS